MSENTKLNSSSGLPENKYTTKSKFVNIFLLVMFTVFPLFYTDYYYNIRHDKYYFFLFATDALLLMLGAVAVTKSDSASAKNEKKAVPWYKKLSFTDYAFGAFILVCTISTVFSQDPYDAFFGISGRNNGLFLMLYYAVVYLLITRFYHFKSYVFVALAGCSIIIYLLDILNCFYIDPLGMFATLTDEQTIANFTSTIGNKNLMSSFICVVMPVTIAFSVLSNKRNHRIIYYISSAFGYMALMTADSYSGILGLGAVFAVQGSGTAFEMKTAELLLKLWRLLYESILITDCGSMSVHSAQTQAKLQIMMQYIHDNYSGQITLDDIAGTVLISKSSVLNIFRTYLSHVCPQKTSFVHLSAVE